MVKLADTLDLGSSAIACRFKSCHPYHKETIILIRKISVLWLFYCQNGGFRAYFYQFHKNLRLAGIVFVLASLFSFYALFKQSFNLWVIVQFMGNRQSYNDSKPIDAKINTEIYESSTPVYCKFFDFCKNMSQND